MHERIDTNNYTQTSFLICRHRFPEPPPEPTGYRKHLKRYKEQQCKKDEFFDILQPYIRQLTAEVNINK